MASIAEQIKTFLDTAWTKVPEKDMDPQPRFASAVATMFIDFVENAEKVFRSLAGRIAVLEQQQATILKSLNLASESAVSTAPASSPAPATAATNGNGKTPITSTKPEAAVSLDTRSMVRLGADDQPMTPEDQAVEEKMDLAMSGKIDESRYVSAASRAG